MVKVVILLLSVVVAVFGNEEYEVSMERSDGIDILQLKNKQGEVKEVIEVHSDEDFQVIKPVDGNDCFISRAGKPGRVETGCIERKQVIPQTPEERRRAKETCENRNVFMLNEANCMDDQRGRGIVKRACQTQTIPSSKCVREETYCKRYGWWWGARTCKEYAHRCAEYTTFLQTYNTCY